MTKFLRVFPNYYDLVVCRRRCSLARISPLMSSAGRISIVPHFNFTPGDWEMS
jgi:hypothetical protein